MIVFGVRRLVGLLVVIVCVSFVAFCLQSIVPADPARAIAGPMAPPATIEAIREELGLTAPLAQQYSRFLIRLIQGDLGTSARTRQPVTSDVVRYLPATLDLASFALLLGVGLGVILGILPVIAPFSRVLRSILIGAASTPILLSTMALIYFFWFKLGWFPGSGRLSQPDFSGPTGFTLLDATLLARFDLAWDALKHLLLPGIALAMPVAIAIGQSLSVTLHDVMLQPYIKAARGRGLSQTMVIFRHALPNAASAPLAMTGLQARLMFGNLLIVERMFSWPGLGLYVVQAFAAGDLAAILGVSIVLAIGYLTIATFVEVLQHISDPRVGPGS